MVAEDKMKKLKCPLCEENVYSGLGEGCRMCGMPLKEFDEEFCSETCKEEYKKINNFKVKSGGKK